jgi:hypothetical protein
MMASLSRRRIALGIATIIFASLGSAAAHERKTAGNFLLVIGWGEEPAFTGSRNSVVVAVSDSAGPLKEAAASLSVEIAFGAERMTLPLEPTFNRPHEYHAWLVPTRAGTYTFHVTGKVRDQAIDVTSTCSESTFHCVAEATDIQFPAKDPSAGQLADRIDRALPRADLATRNAARAQWIAVAALAVALVGAAAAIGSGWRKGRNRV